MTTRLGIPEEVLSDNGSNFVSKTMHQFCLLTGIHQIKISPYHPQTDGMVERFNATMKRLLKKMTQKMLKSGISICPLFSGLTEEKSTAVIFNHYAVAH